MAEDIIAQELMLNRFRRLMNEILRGTLARTTFQAWEVELLLDMESCDLPPRRRGETLRQYLKAVEKQMESGPGPPMKLSEYLQARITRRPKIA